MKTRNTVTAEQIGKIVAATEFKTQTVYGKTTIVSAKLPNGFVIIESSSCVDPANYDEKIGVQACRERIINKIRELEGYKLQDELYRKSQPRDVRDHTIREFIDRGYEIRLETSVDVRSKVIIDDGRA
jgi:transcription antitermination factor NusG